MNKKFHKNAFRGMLVLLLVLTLNACAAQPKEEVIPAAQPTATMEPTSFVTSTESLPACLTDKTWQDSISNPMPIASDLSGTLLAFGRTVEDGKDPNPGNTGMFTINLDGSDKNVFGRGMGADLAPDGTRIVYFSPDVSDGLHLVDVTSGTASHIPNTIANDFLSRWSPDGKQIAFMRSIDSDLYIINPDGTGLHRAFEGIDYEQLIDWTPDGKGLYYSVSTQTGSELRKVDIESGTVVKLFDEGAFSISPDGSKITFSSELNKAYISNIDGSERKLLADMGNWYVLPGVWSPDGKWIIVSIRKPDTPDIAGFPIPWALVNVEDCRIIPIPWFGEIYSWIP